MNDSVRFALNFTEKGDPQARDVAKIDVANAHQIIVSFEPRSEHRLPTFGKPLRTDALIVFHMLFDDNLDVYHRLRQECRAEMTHRLGGSHLGARNPTRSPMALQIRRTIESYFRFVVANMVISCYEDGDRYRPFHQDKFWANESLAIICSFGARRDLSFKNIQWNDIEEHVPQHNGTVTIFDRRLNGPKP